MGNPRALKHSRPVTFAMDDGNSLAAQTFNGRQILLDHDERQLSLPQEAGQHSSDTAVAEQYHVVPFVGIVIKRLR